MHVYCTSQPACKITLDGWKFPLAENNLVIKNISLVTTQTPVVSGTSERDPDKEQEGRLPHSVHPQRQSAPPMIGRNVHRIKIAEHSDVQFAQIAAFYEDNRHPLNSVRDPVDLLRLSGGRRIWTIINELDNPVGASLTVLYSGKHSEVGGTRILKNGFGLQCILYWCQCIHELTFHPPTGNLFAVASSDNEPSIYNLKKCKFEEWTPDVGFLAELGIDKSEAKLKGKNFYRFYAEHCALLARRLIDLYNDPVIVNKRTGEKIFLILDFELLRDSNLRKIVERIADGDVKLPVLD